MRATQLAGTARPGAPVVAPPRPLVGEPDRRATPEAIPAWDRGTAPGRVGPAVTGTEPLAPVFSYRSRRARLGHVVLLLMGWALFGWLWARVLERPGAWQEVRSSLLLVAVLAAATTVVTYAWIRHNVALARRHGNRRSGTPPLTLPERDLLGRALVVDPGVSRARLVVVRADDTTKQFTAPVPAGA